MIKNVIVICDHASVSGGAAKVAISTALGLAEKGINVVYFCGAYPVDPRLESKVKVLCLGQYSIVDDPKRLRAVLQGVWNKTAARELNRLLSEFNKEETVIHIHGWTKVLSSSVIEVSCEMGFKTFLTLHDFFLYCPNGGFYNYVAENICDKKPMSFSCLCCNCDSRSYPQKLWRVIRQFVQNRVIDKYSRKITFLSISDLSERIIRKEFGPEIRVNRLNNVIDEPFELTFDDNREVYLFMARLSPEKGLDLFCESITKLGLKGVVCGDGSLYNEYVAKYKNIDFVGWVSEKQKIKYISIAKACVFPSKWYETFGLAVAEMLSVGVPCIVPKQNAAAELIIDGINGLLFDSGNIEDLVRAMQKMESEKIACDPESVKSSFDEKKYSLENYISNLVEIINQ